MPALQPLSIEADSFVTLDFDPVGVQNGLATYQASIRKFDNNGQLPFVPLSAVLQPTLTISLQKPSKTSKLSKARMKIVIPQPVIVDGVATAAKSHENAVDITFISSEKATSDERYLLLNAIQMLLSNVTAHQVVGENKTIY